MILVNEPMPDHCRECLFRHLDDDYCILYSYGVPERWDVGEKYKDSRPDWCELKEIKTSKEEEAVEYLTAISYKFGTTGVEYLTEKDGEKMREAIEVLKGGING